MHVLSHHPRRRLVNVRQMDLSNLSYLVVDVETTGGSPAAGHRVTEIGAVKIQNGQIVDIFEELVDPEHEISPFISRLTGITPGMVYGKPKFAEVAPQLIEMLTGSIFVGHNAAFDWRFVSAELQRVYSGSNPRALTLCTVKLARILLPQLPRKSLDFVANHYGVAQIAQSYPLKRSVRHSAAGDAVVTAHCLLRMFDEAADRGVTTWDELQRLAYPNASRKVKKKRTALPTSTFDDRTA